MVPGMKLEMRSSGVDYSAGPIWAADIVAFEKKYDQPGESIFSEGGVRTEWLAYVGWHALVRAGEKPPEFDEFIAALETIQPLFEGGDDEGKALGPNRAQRRGSSRRSSSNSESHGPSSSHLAATS